MPMNTKSKNYHTESLLNAVSSTLSQYPLIHNNIFFELASIISISLFSDFKIFLDTLSKSH